MITRVFVIFTAFFLASCASGPGKFGYDNPQIRKLQQEQSAYFVRDSVTRSKLIRFIGPKVETMRSGPVSGEFRGGRGAAISSDGYFLTAYHVVKGSAFFLTGPILAKNQFRQLKRDGVLQVGTADIKERSIRGRLVWHDEEADLAIVKFPVRSPNYFRRFRFPLELNTVVLATDDQGRSIALPDKNGHARVETAVGNGPFFSAGSVLSQSSYGSVPGRYTSMTSLVGRGGMSGAPLVNLEGELCGVLSRVRLTLNVSSRKVWKSSRTTARMLEPSLIRKIVRKDRALR